MSKTAYMSRADVIVLLSANAISNMLDSHGGSYDVPKRIVAFAIKLANELVTQGIVDADEPDSDVGGRFYPDETYPAEDTPPLPSSPTEPAPPMGGDSEAEELPKVSEAPPAPPSDFGTVPTSVAQTPPPGPPDPTYVHS